MKPVLFLAFCLALALPAWAATDPFAEFRIPGHSWQSGSAAAGFAAMRSHQGVPATESRASALASLLQGRLARGWDSDALRYGYGIVLEGRVQAEDRHSLDEYEPLGYRVEDDRVGRDALESWQLDGSLRSYPLRVPLGLEIAVLAAGTYAQSLDRSDRLLLQSVPAAIRNEMRESFTRHVYGTQLRVDLSAGHGRVRDASVVYDVHVLEERLAETGALARPLSPQARERLAALYYVTPFYGKAHERPDRFVWRDIERIVREDGALRGEDLDAYSVLRAAEGTAPGGRPMRQRGWFVGAVGGATTTHQIDRVESQNAYRYYVDDVLLSSDAAESSGRYVDSYDQILLGGRAEYHLPVGWRWQFDAATRLTCPARVGERGLDLSTAATASWYVFDRWAASGSLQHARDYFASDDFGGLLQFDYWLTAASAGIAYFIEDRTSLSLTIVEQQRRGLFSPSSPRRFERYGQVYFGATYRFLGRLDAPGLIEPVRMMR